MKIAYLSGAYKNAGDFLIEKRAIELIRHVYPEAEITRFLRNEIKVNTASINNCDAAVIGGGPVFKTSLVTYMPLEIYVQEIRIPTMILGGGWYGSNGSSHAVQQYKFDGPTRAFLEKIYADGFGFSCRDLHTVNVLRENGFPRTVMTGCPAWYDVRYVDNIAFKNDVPEIKTIFVSDPAKLSNLKGAVELVDYLRERYPQAEIKFVFHRGTGQDRFTSGKSAAARQQTVLALQSRGVHTEDISYGADGFSLYDKCDLHVGYRVHAHIYNLSIRNRSVLIEEDGRGAGVNETLGLPSIRAYDDTVNFSGSCFDRAVRKIGGRPNTSMISELDSYLTLLEDADYAYLLNAFQLQRQFLRRMTDYLRQLC